MLSKIISLRLVRMLLAWRFHSMAVYGQLLYLKATQIDEVKSILEHRIVICVEPQQGDSLEIGSGNETQSLLGTLP